MQLNRNAAQNALDAFLAMQASPIHDAHVRAYIAQPVTVAPIVAVQQKRGKRPTLIEIIDACDELQAHEIEITQSAGIPQIDNL